MFFKRSTFFFSVVTFVFFGVLASLFISAGITETSADEKQKVGGWAWNPTIGWIRQRDAILDKQTGDKKGGFGVDRIKATGELSGWSWSSKEGWICWGKTCTQDPALADTQKYGPQPQVPPNPAFLTARVNPADNTVDGWIKVVARKRNGWVSLSQRTSGGIVRYGVTYDPDKNEFKGWAWGGPKLGWIVFSGGTLADREFLYKQGPQVGKVACEPFCSASVDASDLEAPLKSKWKTAHIGAWLQTKGGALASVGGFDLASAPPELYFGNSQFIILTGRLGNARQPLLGVKSLCEDSSIPASTCKNFGVIQGQLGGRQKAGELSFALPKKVEITISRDLALVKRTHLKTKGAFLDIDALVTQSANNPDDDRKNRYGKKVVKLPLPSQQFVDSPEGRLYTYLNSITSGGSIFYNDGDLTIGERSSTKPWMIMGGSVGKSGARTVVVKGDLTIKRSLNYEKLGASNVKQLPSIAWVVLKRDDGSGGNIHFDPCIPPSEFGRLLSAHVSGVFFAEGSISTGEGSGTVCKNDQKFIDEAVRLQAIADSYAADVVRLTAQANAIQDPLEKAAKLKERDDTLELQKKAQSKASIVKNPTYEIPLVINGLTIAKSYNLQRTYGDTDLASENIFNDGRYLVSIPPGLEDFLKSLPSQN